MLRHIAGVESEAYYRRLALDAPPVADLEALRLLQRAHLGAVAFETARCCAAAVVPGVRPNRRTPPRSTGQVGSMLRHASGGLTTVVTRSPRTSDNTSAGFGRTAGARAVTRRR